MISRPNRFWTNRRILCFTVISSFRQRQFAPIHPRLPLTAAPQQAVTLSPQAPPRRTSPRIVWLVSRRRQVRASRPPLSRGSSVGFTNSALCCGGRSASSSMIARPSRLASQLSATSREQGGRLASARCGHRRNRQWRPASEASARSRVWQFHGAGPRPG